MSFSRPKGGQHTRHLFVGNCGPSVGVDGGTLQQIFCEYGTATVVIPEQQQNPRSAFVFVTYSNAEEASAALSALNDRPCAAAGGRYFNIKYADLKKEQAGPTWVLKLQQCRSFKESCCLPSRKWSSSLWRFRQKSAQ